MRWRTCILRQVSLFPNQSLIQDVDGALPPLRPSEDEEVRVSLSRNLGWGRASFCLWRNGNFDEALRAFTRNLILIKH